MKLSEFKMPVPGWNKSTWWGGHFWSGRDPSRGVFSQPPCARAHTGWDIAAPWGAPIYAPAVGEVVVARWQNSGIGHAVIIDHGLVEIDVPGPFFGETRWVFSRQGHMAPDRRWYNPMFEVSEGEWAQAGQRLGKVGNSGASAGPHDHSSLTVGGPEYKDWTEDAHLDPEMVYIGESPGYYDLIHDSEEDMEAIKGKQRNLNAFGYGPLVVDGKYGPATEAAEQAFMEDSLNGGGNMKIVEVYAPKGS